MNKIIFLILFLVFNIIFAEQTIVIAASPIPHAQILKLIKPLLKKQGINLIIKEFDGAREMDNALIQKSVDANYFQTIGYLRQYNKESNSNLVSIALMHNEPLGLYASNSKKMQQYKKTKKLSMLPKNTIIAIAADVVNQNRGLRLLEANGFITLNPKKTTVTIKDIVENKYSLIFKELDPTIMSRIIKIGDVDLAIINSNCALLSNINPKSDSVLLEKPQKDNINLVVVRPNEANQPKFQKLVTALHDKSVKSYIEKTFKGAVVPAF